MRSGTWSESSDPASLTACSYSSVHFFGTLMNTVGCSVLKSSIREA
jgi:hypothetical protein